MVNLRYSQCISNRLIFDFVASNYLIVSYLNLQALSTFGENVSAFKNDYI